MSQLEFSQFSAVQSTPAHPWTIGDLTAHITELFESEAALQQVWLAGEISNFSRAASGHLYFTLKDSRASLSCVMWRSTAAGAGTAS